MLKIAMICSTRSDPYWPMSSRRPMNGETKAAPALAARRACSGEKIRVTLTLMPSEARILVALRVSTHMGSLTLMLGWMAASSLPSFTISSAVVDMASAEMGPSTISAISLTRVRTSTPSLAMRLGLVVTPSRIPQLLISLIMSRLAVSMKIFIGFTSLR